jgi:hypothetical protein
MNTNDFSMDTGDKKGSETKWHLFQIEDILRELKTAHKG